MLSKNNIKQVVENQYIINNNNTDKTVLIINREAKLQKKKKQKKKKIRNVIMHLLPGVHVLDGSLMSPSPRMPNYNCDGNHLHYGHIENAAISKKIDNNQNNTNNVRSESPFAPSEQIHAINQKFSITSPSKRKEKLLKFSNQKNNGFNININHNGENSPLTSKSPPQSYAALHQVRQYYNEIANNEFNLSKTKKQIKNCEKNNGKKNTHMLRKKQLKYYEDNLALQHKKEIKKLKHVGMKKERKLRQSYTLRHWEHGSGNIDTNYNNNNNNGKNIIDFDNNLNSLGIYISI